MTRMEYIDLYALKHEIKNDYNETKVTSFNSIIFPNGYIASIVKMDNDKYSVSVCDYNGCFNWSLLKNYCESNPINSNGKCICNTESEIQYACNNIRRLPKNPNF